MATKGAPLRFTKSMRMKLPADFERARREGKRVAKGALLANWRTLPTDSVTRLGVVTSKRIGRATVRNRARRLLRESFRLHQGDFLAPVDLVLVARRSITNRRFQDVERDFLDAMKRAGLFLQTSEPAANHDR